MNASRHPLWLPILFVLLVWLAPTAIAQNVNGTILGTIKDATGAVIASTPVVVTNEATNIETKVETGETGEYVAPNLPPGSYTIRVERAGFKPAVIREVRLLANRAARIDVTLETGTVTQTVEVEASAPVVNSENATIGNIMESNSITQLPLNGRTLDRLIRISAGVTTDSASNPRVAGSSYWGGIQFNVDGVSYNDFGNGGGAYSYRNGLSTLPSVDAVSEFKMDSNNQKAEFEASSSVTIVTKTGTNELHGSAFEFNRNKEVAANNFFSNAAKQPRPPYNRNEFGFTLGGPIRKDKTFIFGDYEGLRERFARTNSGLSMPTQAMRNGDFTGLPTIVDPLSGVPFGNNQIPSNRIDSRSKTLLGYVPLPNLPGSGAMGALQNYTVNIGNVSDVNRYGVRLDNRFSDKDSVWAAFQYSKGDPYFVAQGYPATYGQWSNGGYETASMNVTENHTFTPRTLNEFRLGWMYHGSVRLGINTDFNPQTLFPDLYGPLPVGGLPEINFSSYTPIGDYGGSERGKQYTTQYMDNFTHVHGKHTIKAGIDFANYRISNPPGAFGLNTSINQEAAFGRFGFNGRFTTEDITKTAAPSNSIADFLLGYPTTAYRSTATPVTLSYQTRYSAYVQDDFQVSQRLTLSYGIRYMVQTSWKERDHAQANLDFNLNKLVLAGDSVPRQAITRLVSAYPTVTAKDAGLPLDILQTDKNNFAPRFGFAYRPFANNKTVVRGGAGFFYNILPYFIGFRQLGFSNPPFQLSETFEAAAGRTPTLTLAAPFPGAGAISPNPALTVVQSDIQNGRSMQWNLTVEREVASNLGLRASYVGNKTVHLPWYNKSINLPQTQAPGTIQPRRPWQPWADILILAGGGDSTIHQLQLEAVKRYSYGLSFQAEYSWNRSLDDVPVVGGPQNPYDNRGDRGNSDQIRRHIFTIAYNYELPIGQGKPLNVEGPLNKLAGGWGIGGITYLRTGQPFSVGFSATQTGWLGGRADAVAGKNGALSRGERSMLRWFDASAFSVPAPFTWGNSARNLLFTPGDIVFDVSLLKDTRITERLNMQFRAEFFNMPNHTNLGGPATNISVPSTVGRITSAGDPRQVQFGVKFLF